jgi:hypothetical protein
MLAIGTNVKTHAIANASPSDLKVHTMVLGQSGSGKSFFLARLLEELLLKTKARIVAIDPNGDFETFFAPREEDFWTHGDLAERLKTIKDLQTRQGHNSFDDKRTFVESWRQLRFQHVIAGRRNRIPLSDNAFGAPLKLHWKFLAPDMQDFLLGLDESSDPKLMQGIAACHYYVNNNIAEYQRGVSLRDLEDIASLFEQNKIAPSLTLYDIAISLESADWTRVRTHFRVIRKKYGRIMYLKRLRRVPGQDSLATDLGGYVFRGFQNPELAANPAWNFLSVSLAGLPSHHSLLACYVALQNIWFNSIATWRKAREDRLEKVQTSVLPTGRDRGYFDEEKDQAPEPEIEILGETEVGEPEDEETEVSRFGPQKPTFVVIDEAHNFVPEYAESALQKKVSDFIATIAAEGRKYNIFLIISTQRPGKLRKGLVAECENVAVLKLQSSLERTYLTEHTSIPLGEERRIGDLDPGQSLVSGRWFKDAITVRTAPARTFLGGENIADKDWII